MPDRCVTSTRAGSEIIIRVQCGDDYEAMELHDRIIATVAERGQVTLRIGRAESPWESQDSDDGLT
jgi:hypothetical protein